jgi:hypothetical protein
MGLGLSGAYGAAEGQLALKRLQAEDLQRQEIAKRDMQQKFENELALRRIVEAELTGQTGREVSKGGLGLSRDRFTEIEKPASARAADKHAPEMRVLNQTADMGDLKLRTISGLSGLQQQQMFSGLDFEDIASPEAQIERGRTRGQAAGAGALAGFEGGGRQVLQGTEDVRGAWDLRRGAQANAGALQRAMVDQVRTQNDPNMQALAAQAAENPELLDGMSPTDRTKVMALIAGNGQLTTTAQAAARKQAADALAAIEDLRKTPGQAGAVGMPNSLAGIPRLLGYDAAPGSQERGYAAKLAELRAKLTMPRMGMIKGVLSDADMKMLRESASALDANTGEDFFNRELNNVEAVLRRAVAGQQAGSQPAAAGGVVEWVIDPKTGTLVRKGG